MPSIYFRVAVYGAAREADAANGMWPSTVPLVRQQPYHERPPPIRTALRCGIQYRSIHLPPPQRLTNFLPPDNFGTVDEHMIYRSGQPKLENIPFLRLLGLRTILILHDENIQDEYHLQLTRYNIDMIKVRGIPQNKNGIISMRNDAVAGVIHTIMDGNLHPMLIHCNGGKHRTGVVIACFRKVRARGDDRFALDEYGHYAREKARDADRHFIREFDISTCFDKAYLRGWLEPDSEDPDIDSEGTTSSDEDVIMLDVYGSDDQDDDLGVGNGSAGPVSTTFGGSK